MPPKAAQTDKTYSSETIGALLAALLKRGVNVGNAEYQIMATINAGTSASSYEHQFREIKKQAAEISKGLGGEGTPVKAAKAPKTATPTTGKKRGAKAAATQDGDDDVVDTPTKQTKKAKVEKKTMVKREESATPAPIVEDGTDTNVYGGGSFFDEASPFV